MEPTAQLFFLMTGFHGIHVIVGTVFLIVVWYRLSNQQLFSRHTTGLECAIWYWHFVDVVWLFLFLSIYYWGNKHFIPETTTLIMKPEDACDTAKPYGLFFQDSATSFMENIINLHGLIAIILVPVIVIIAFLFIEMIRLSKTNNLLFFDEDSEDFYAFIDPFEIQDEEDQLIDYMGNSLEGGTFVRKHSKIEEMPYCSDINQGPTVGELRGMEKYSDVPFKTK